MENKNKNRRFYYLPIALSLIVTVVAGVSFSSIHNGGSANLVAIDPMSPGAAAGSITQQPKQEPAAGDITQQALQTQQVPNAVPAPLPPAKFGDKVMTTFDQKDNPFNDTKTADLNGRAAAELYRRGVISGLSDGVFGGDKPVNRAEAAKFLLLAKYGTVADANGTSQFKDVLKGAWYEKYIQDASKLGIINGYSDKTFKPGNGVNTAEFLKMLTLTFNIKTDFPPIYLDVKNSDWFAPYAGIAEEYNLFPDQVTGYFKPGEFLTRSEVAIAIYQYLLNSTLYDFGDAPDPGFPSTLASNGARHIYTNLVYFGKCVTKEYDALTPDQDQCDDGIVSVSPLRVRVSISDFVSWTTAMAGVSSLSLSPFYINILMDRNNNGTWEPDNGEWVVQNQIWHIGDPSLVTVHDIHGNPINWNPSDDGRLRMTISSPLWDTGYLYLQQPLTHWNGSWPTAFAAGETEDHMTFVPPSVDPTPGNPVTGGNPQFASVECPLKDTYPIVVNFNRDSLRADSSPAASKNGPMPITLPAGNYEIALSSFDTHTTLPQPTQLLEQWFLKLIDSSGATVGTTQAIGDLPDGTNVLTQIVEANFNVATPVSSVLAVHAAYPTVGNTEDILPVCAGFKRTDKG